MGEDHFERTFECPCKKSTMTASWSEHDTWPSPNRSLGWEFDCGDCKEAYRFYDDSIIRSEDAEQLAALRTRTADAKRAVLDAAIQHQGRFIAYVVGLPTKVAQHDVLGDGSYGTFLKYTKRPGYVQRQAEIHFHVSPKKCLDRLGIKDSAVDELHSKALAAEKIYDAFQQGIKRTPLPFR